MARRLRNVFLGWLAVVAVLELAFRLLPVPTATMTGYYRDPDLLTYPAHHQWRTATGWDLHNAQTLTSNNWGFSAQHDFVAGQDAVALIGDSFVEASMLDVQARPAAQLQALLSGRQVYAMGTPGTALLDYAQRVRFARDQFGIRDMVLLLESGDVRQALCGSGNVVSRCLDPVTLEPRIVRRPAPGLAQRLVRHSALAQYLIGQLRFRPQSLLSAMFTRSTPEQSQRPTQAANTSPDAAQVARAQQVVDAVVAEFFAAIGDPASVNLVVVIDAGRRPGTSATQRLLEVERDHLITRLRERGATVQSLESVYAAHAARSRRSLEVGPYDRHLNRLGVYLAMSAAAQLLAGNGEEAE